MNVKIQKGPSTTIWRIRGVQYSQIFGRGHNSSLTLLKRQAFISQQLFRKKTYGPVCRMHVIDEEAVVVSVATEVVNRGIYEYQPVYAIQQQLCKNPGCRTAHRQPVRRIV